MNVENDHDDHHHGKCSCHFFHCYFYFCQRRLGKISHTSITTLVVVRMHVKKTTFSITFFSSWNSIQEGNSHYAKIHIFVRKIFKTKNSSIFKSHLKNSKANKTDFFLLKSPKLTKFA